MGSELRHRALHSSTSHSRLQLRACSGLGWRRNWLGDCLYTWPVLYNWPQSSAVWPADSRRKVREIETWATRAFRRRKQVETVRMKRIGAALAQGLGEWWIHDDDLPDPEYEYTVSRHLMAEGILKYSRFCDKNILMIHFLLLCQNYPLPDNEIHQKNLCSRSSKI